MRGVSQEERWESARRELVTRWGRVLERIEARDEGGTLELINVMDEFCDQAMNDREAGLDRPVPRPGVARPAGEEVTGRCRFCRGFAEAGGCFGTLELVNRAVLDGRWEEAERLASRYRQQLRDLRLSPQQEPAWRP